MVVSCLSLLSTLCGRFKNSGPLCGFESAHGQASVSEVLEFHFLVLNFIGGQTGFCIRSQCLVHPRPYVVLLFDFMCMYFPPLRA
jgi:hypothetical protein